jgi:Flp pilus assembly protein TadD
MALDEKSKNAEALVVFLEADKLQPNDAEILRLIARQYCQLIPATTTPAGKKQLALKSLDPALRAVQADPENANARLSLAIVYGRVAEHEGARRKVELSRLIKQEAEAAVRLDPGQELAWHILGRWNYELANFNPVLKALAQTIYGKFPDASNAKAAEHLQKAIALNPRSVLHHVELGRTYAALGEKTKARQEIEKGLALPSLAKDDEETKQRGRQALKQL